MHKEEQTVLLGRTSSLEMKNQQLQEQLISCAQAKNDACEEQYKLKHRIRSLEMDTELLREQLASSAKQRIYDHEKQQELAFKELEMEATTLRDQLVGAGQMEREAHRCREERDALARAVKVLQAEAQQLRSLLADADDREVPGFREERQKLTQAVGTLQAETQHLRGQLATAQLQSREAKEAGVRIQDLLRTIADLQRESAQLRKQLVQAEDGRRPADRQKDKRSKANEIFLQRLLTKADELGYEAKKTRDRRRVQSCAVEDLRRERDQLREQAARALEAEQLVRSSAESDFLKMLRAVRHIDRDLYC